MHKRFERGTKLRTRAAHAFCDRSNLTVIGSQDDNDSIRFCQLISAQNDPVGPVALGNIGTGSTGTLTWCLIQRFVQPLHRAYIGSQRK